ncbi:Lsr2 protein [Raineyella antarctica]|uniref:Lsr2 protein n=1 Tax=Raineyella antarctica TaxID=1577474 RepID=A0A1G6IK02_9ACTN|nr:Lsr2 family protein [Raineyella antarctica]SDC06794.1 Lsr2 protein [Raineyella antarctica]
MARRTMLILEDDLDATPAQHQVTFSFEGVSYEIDLNEEHYSELQEAMAPWVSHARRVSGRRTTAKRSSSAPTGGGSGTSATAIREWARTQGIEVSDRGRVPANVRASYEEAHA